MSQRSRSSHPGIAVFLVSLFMFLGLAGTIEATPALEHEAAAAEAQQKAKGTNTNGPSFCRSGEGHPVYGRQWCLQKGFPIGDGPLWGAVGVGEIVFTKTPRGRIDGRPLGWQEIAEILSHTAVDILFDKIGSNANREDVSGRWRGGESYGAFVLELMEGDEPLAELADTNGDGRVDVVIAPERGSLATQGRRRHAGGRDKFSYCSMRDPESGLALASDMLVGYQEGGNMHMPPETSHIAVDLGASSGRVFLGRIGGELVLEELHRFPNPVEHGDGHLRWNPRFLLSEIQTGLGKALEAFAATGETPRRLTVGVDTWGVDYCLLDESLELIEDPICYRDPRTRGTASDVLSILDGDDLYQRTGNQLLEINTLFQLWVHVRSGNWPGEVGAICMMPDLFHFWLSGSLNVEYTIATTSQLLRVGTKEWDADLLSLIELPGSVLPRPTEPGRRLGSVKQELLSRLLPAPCPPLIRTPTPNDYPDIEVVVPASHDTASAVVGTPLTKGWAFLSCGTWSLLGLELPEPEVGPVARRYEFSNEGGPENTIRFLKNVNGLWILNSCLEIWRREGKAGNLDELLAQLAQVVPGTSFIVPDDPCFLGTEDMVRRITGFLRDTEQAIVESPVDVARMIMDSLALRFAQIIDQLAEATGSLVPGIHAVGGGSQNSYLMQATANATQLPVVAGPVEATALGNVLTQAIGIGSLRDLPSARRWAHAEMSLRTFSPRHQAEWSAARLQFDRLSAT